MCGTNIAFGFFQVRCYMICTEALMLLTIAMNILFTYCLTEMALMQFHGLVYIFSMGSSSTKHMGTGCSRDAENIMAQSLEDCPKDCKWLVIAVRTCTCRTPRKWERIIIYYTSKVINHSLVWMIGYKFITLW